MSTSLVSERVGVLLFEQQPREGARAFAAFRDYLEMGPDRTLATVATKVGKSRTMIERWSRRFDWPARVQAHAAHVAEVERKAIEGLAIEKAVEWHKVHEAVRIAEWQRHKKLIALADEMLARWERNKAKCGTLEGIARVLELATKLGRLAAGMPTEVKEVNTMVKATIDVDWEIAIRRAYGAQESAKCEVRSAKEDVVDIEEVRSPMYEVRSGGQSLVTSAPTREKV